MRRLANNSKNKKNKKKADGIIPGLNDSELQGILGRVRAKEVRYVY